MVSHSEKLNIRITEIYYEQSPIDELEILLLRLYHKYKVYFCNYQEGSNKFIRVGIMNPSDEDYQQFLKDIQISKDIKIKTWIEQGEPHMELMKFTAFDTWVLLENHKIKYKDIYDNIPARKYTPSGLPRNKPEELDVLDFINYFHHLINMQDITYPKEIMIYQMCAANIQASNNTSLWSEINDLQKTKQRRIQTKPRKKRNTKKSHSRNNRKSI